MAKNVEITPGAFPPVPEDVEQLDEIHQKLLSYGFDDCQLRIPTQTWHGTRVELYVDLEKQQLPYIAPRGNKNKLVLWTLSGIGLDTGITDGELPNYLSRRCGVLGKIAIDKEIFEHMTSLTEVGNELALQGFGYLNERPWISTINSEWETGDPIMVSGICGVKARRIKKECENVNAERKKYWKDQGWSYSTGFSEERSVSVWRWLDYDAREGTINDVIQSITCNEEMRVTGRISPDYGSSQSIDPLGPLSIDQLAKLQSDTQTEVERGILSDKYLANSS